MDVGVNTASYEVHCCLCFRPSVISGVLYFFSKFKVVKKSVRATRLFQMETGRTPEQEGKSRKVIPQPEKWKKNVEKCNRHKPSSLPTYPTCTHDRKQYYCGQFLMADVKYFHSLFYQKPQKTFQDHVLVQHIRMKSVARRRVETSPRVPRNATAQFYVRLRNQELRRVCRKAFLEILGITMRRINTVIKNFRDFGNTDERRGGFRKRDEFDEKTNKIVTFVSSLDCSESHYCRGRSNRKYLPADLNIEKLYKMFCVEVEGGSNVKSSYFRMVFNNKFNIGFGAPRTDVCSTCLQLQEKIKIERDEDDKRSLTTQLDVHKGRAAAFFRLLHEDDSKKILILSFDCEKNIALPRLPDQSVNYSRQFYSYNLTVVKGPSKTTLNAESVTSYIWTENEYPKDSNAIASCVLDALKSCPGLPSYTSVRLVSDGCGGQNKNTVMVSMAMKWLTFFAPQNIDHVELVFPVTGHSYIPPDRVFGLIEREIKKKEVILTTAEVHEIVSHHSTVKKLFEDCEVFDFKSAVKGVVRICSSWHFKISQCKRIFLRRSSKNPGNILARGEIYFRNDTGMYKSLFARDKKAEDISFIPAQKMNKISAEKKKDVQKLLETHYGDDWRSLPDLGFYAFVIDGAAQEDPIEDTNNVCEPPEEVYDCI